MAEQPSEQEPSEQELREQIEAELKKLKVSDVLVQALVTVSSLGYQRLAPETRDLEQAKLAIESLRALVPVLKGAVPDEVVRDFEQVTANMQLAYAKAVAEAKPEPPVRESGPGEGARGKREAPPTEGDA